MSNRDFRSVNTASVLNGALVLFMEGSEEAAIEKKQSIKKKKKRKKGRKQCWHRCRGKIALLGKHCISKMVFLC